jgi:hypothetical protein
MGVVYKAEHRLMKRVVALKVISPRLTANGAAIARFHREVEAVAKLAHTNIAAAYDADEVDGQLVLVEEFIEGTDLAQVVQEQGPLPVAQACGYIRQAALALQHAHERGILHRDIKPSNLIVTGDAHVKVLDFGLASLRDQPGDEDHAEPGTSASPANPTLTDFGQGMGTADFVAPEQVRDAHAADFRSDIYSLGRTLVFLLTGRSEAPLPVRLPRALVSILDRMTAAEPAQRFQTMTEVAAALSRFADEGKECRVNRRLLMALGMGLLVGLLGVWLYRQHTNRDGKFHPLSLEKVATAVSTRPLFTNGRSERLIFPSWGVQRVFDIPFDVLDPLGDQRKNGIVLYGPLDSPAKEMPKIVRLPCGFRAKSIHLLGGVAGWGYQGPGEGAPGTMNHKSVSMIVRLDYADGTREDHELLNGVHICDFCTNEDGDFYEVPGSTVAMRLKPVAHGPKQIRYLAIHPKKPESVIAGIEFIKGENSITSPVVMAVTIEEP